MMTFPLTLRKRLRRLMILSISTTLIIFTIYFVAIDNIFKGARVRALEMGFRPSESPTSPMPELQTEPHTCGLHALESLYKAYGLDTRHHNLRFRLGIDIPAVPWVKLTQGALQPDLFRVLAQDGFKLELVSLDISLEIVRKKIFIHMLSGHKSIALIKKPSNGSLHWIVIDKQDNDLVIVDSQHPSPYAVDPDDLITNNLVTLLLVSQEPNPCAKTVKDGYRLGVKAMKLSTSRLK